MRKFRNYAFGLRTPKLFYCGMEIKQQIAKHLRQVHHGGNWTASSLKENLKGVSWQQATTKVGSLNTIAALVYHMNYFVDAVLKVMQGRQLDAHDKFSFDLPLIQTQEDWENLLAKSWDDAERLASLIEQMPESKLWEDFADAKYGNYYRNLYGIVEHCHYHLGQVVVVKKLLAEADG